MALRHHARCFIVNTLLALTPCPRKLPDVIRPRLLASRFALNGNGTPIRTLPLRTRKVRTSPILNILVCSERRQHFVEPSAHLCELALVARTQRLVEVAQNPAGIARLTPR